MPSEEDKTQQSPELTPKTEPVAVPDVVARFPVLGEIDLQESLHPQWAVPNLEKAVQIIFIAEAAGKISAEQISVELLSSLKRQLNSDQINFEDEKKKYDETPEDKRESYQKYSYARKTEEIADLEKFIKQAESDPAYLEKWWQKIKGKLQEAQQKVVDRVAQQVDTELTALFAEFFEAGKLPKSIHERAYPLFMEQYIQLAKSTHVSGDNAIDFAYMTGGFATFPEVGKDRALVLKVMVSRLNSFEDKDTEFPVMLYPQVKEASSFGMHEGIHIWADGMRPSEIIDTPDGKRIKEQRGFHTFFFMEDGKEDRKSNMAEMKKTPHQAVDEGAVVFMDAYVASEKNLDDVEKFISRQRNLSPAYVEAAKVTLKLARIIGVEKLLENYAHSNLDGWLAAIGQALGPNGLQNYLDTMRDLQNNMSIYQQ